MWRTKSRIDLLEDNTCLNEIHRKRKLPIKNCGKKVNIGPSYVISWKRDDSNYNFLSELKGISGVYVIYDDSGCMYVGTSGGKRGIFNRLRYHEKLTHFKETAELVVCYRFDDKKERLLFEMVKIIQLNPSLNSDEKGLTEELIRKYEDEVEDKIWDIIEQICEIETTGEFREKLQNGTITYQQVYNSIISQGISEIKEDFFQVFYSELIGEPSFQSEEEDEFGPEEKE